jgi:hypothetical protein
MLALRKRTARDAHALYRCADQTLGGFLQMETFTWKESYLASEADT